MRFLSIQLQQSQKELSEFYNMYCDVFERILKTNYLDSELPDIYNKCILSSVYKIKVSDNLLGEETMEEALKRIEFIQSFYLSPKMTFIYFSSFVRIRMIVTVS